MALALLVVYGSLVDPGWLRRRGVESTTLRLGPGGDTAAFLRVGDLTATGEIVGLAAIPNGAVIPVLGMTPAELHDSYGAPRPDERRHTGIDIMAPKGTLIGAAVDGWIISLSHSEAGGLGLVQVDRTGRLRLYYGHLDGYAEPMYRGRAVRRGELLGYVGATGNARGAHLHFEVGRISGGGAAAVTPINPYLFLTGRAAH